MHNRAESRPRNGGGSNHSLPTATDFAGMEVVNNVFDPRTPAALRRRTGIQVGLDYILYHLRRRKSARTSHTEGATNLSKLKS